MNISKRGWGAVWRHPGHLIWILAAYLPFLGKMSIPLTGDQKVYISIAMEMRERSAWLSPFLFGETNYLKPPFQYWATLVGWNIFGFNYWGTLLPSVFFVLLTAWLLGEIAYLLNERRWFVNAGLWFGAALSTITYGTTAQMEIYVVGFYAASWWMGLRYLKEPIGSRNLNWLYSAFLIAGLAALVKSPLYSVFWVVGFTTYLLISGEWEILISRHFYLANLVGIVAGLSWYFAIYIHDHDRFWAEYVVKESINKKYGNNSSLATIWGALLYFCYPFTLLLVPSIRAVWKRRSRGSILRFAFSWTWPPALFFSLYPYRISPYLYILVPLFAVLVDWAYFRSGRSRAYRVFTWLTGVLMAFAMMFVAFIFWRFELVSSAIVTGFVAAGAWALYCAHRDWMRGLALCGLAGVLFFRSAAATLGEADVAGLVKASQSCSECEIAMLDENRNIWHELGLLSVRLGKQIRRTYRPDEVRAVIDRGGIVVLSEEQRDRVMASEAFAGKTDLITSEWHRWRTRAAFPFKEILLNGKDSVPDIDKKMRRTFYILKKAT